MKEKLMPLLILLLIGAAFAIGSMWTQLRYVKKETGESGKVAGQQEANQPSPEVQLPEQQVLAEADWNKILADPVAVKGNEGAPITIIEFSEYECPFCARYFEQTYQQLWEQYGDKIRYIFRDYPLAFHQHTADLALAARCAGEQGQYFDFHDQLFSNQADIVELSDISNKMVDLAQELNLDETQFSDCYDSGKYNQAVNDDFELGQSVGVSGTPTFFINGQQLVGAQPFENFQAIIDFILE